MTGHTADRDGLTESPSALRNAVVALLLLVATGGALDLALDRPTSWWSAHVMLEVVLTATSLTTAGVLWRGWRRAARSAGEVRRALSEREAQLEVERQLWRQHAQDALAGLGRAIERQFDVWSLTPAERDIAVLLLKGRGHKQIAAATNRSERTVRQHAVSVYRKAGVAGRAELAAFFLEDLPEHRSPTG